MNSPQRGTGVAVKLTVGANMKLTVVELMKGLELLPSPNSPMSLMPQARTAPLAVSPKK